MKKTRSHQDTLYHRLLSKTYREATIYPRIFWLTLQSEMKGAARRTWTLPRVCSSTYGNMTQMAYELSDWSELEVF
jgi:hypothetical protein